MTTHFQPGTYQVYPVDKGKIDTYSSIGEYEFKTPERALQQFSYGKSGGGGLSLLRTPKDEPVEGGGLLVLRHGVPIAFLWKVPANTARFPHVRENPVTYKTAEGKRRTLTPENCPSHLAASMLAEQHWAESQGLKPPKRFGNCTLQSAQYAVANHKPGRGPGGKAFSGEVHRGYYPDADWTVRLHSGVVMSYWKRQLAAGVVRPPPRRCPSPSSASAACSPGGRRTWRGSQ